MARRKIKEARKIVSTVRIVEDNGKKLFIKKYQKDYPAKLITTEFEKSLKINALLNGPVRTPKPLWVKGREICYEYIEGIEFKSYMLRNYNLFNRNVDKVKNALRLITKAVAQIHEELRLDKCAQVKIPGVADNKLVPILSDLCNSNIIISKDTIYLLDFSPSEYMFNADTCNILSNYHIDLVHLIYAMRLPPLHHRLLIPHKMDLFEREILQTYINKRGGVTISKADLAAAKKYYLNRYGPTVTKGALGIIWKTIINSELRRI